MYKISAIHINETTDPIGITGQIAIGWSLEADCNQMIQTGYQIQIASTSDYTEPVYDSGLVRSHVSSQIRIGFANWNSLERYYVRCCSYNQNGESTGWAETSFVTGVCNQHEFKGDFITAEEENEADQSQVTCLESNLILKKKKIHSAYAVVTALGLYELYLNDKKVGRDVLAPGWTSYHHRLR